MIGNGNGATSQASTGYDLLVVGAGISGLVAAWHVVRRRPEWRVLVVDTASRPGGAVRTDTLADCVFEWGPPGFTEGSPPTHDLIHGLGLDDQVIRASERASQRWLCCRGELSPLPTTPRDILRSKLLSRRGRVRAFTELFRRAGNGDEETVHGFLTRRFGSEAAELIGDTLVTGVFAGDPRNLSLSATFPSLARMEQESGSVLRGLVASRRRKQSVPRLTSFRSGMETLARTLALDLGRVVQCGTRVERVEAQEHGYQITGELNGLPWSARTRRLVLAVPASTARCLLEVPAPRVACLLGEIPTTSVTVAGLVYPRAAVAHTLDGFGFLAPRCHGPRLLGCAWVGSTFVEHVPEDRVLLRAMIGGSRDPEGALLSEARTVELLHGELGRLLGISAAPQATVVARHPRGIPQYTLGHVQRVAALEAEVDRYPGLYLGGNSLRGVSVNDCIREGTALGLRLAHDAAVDASIPELVGVSP